MVAALISLKYSLHCSLSSTRSIILLRMLFTWYFQRKLNKNSDKLRTLRGEKKKILEKVMDTETYKVILYK